jgi:hypothetical protein
MRRLVVLLSIIVFVSACGHDSPTTPAPFTQTQPGNVVAFGTTVHTLSIQRTGQMTVVLTWTDPTIDLDFYLAAASCTAQLYPLANCGIVAASTAGVGTVRETISRSVTAGENFTLWIDNLSPTKPTTYSLELTIQ